MHPDIEDSRHQVTVIPLHHATSPPLQDHGQFNATCYEESVITQR